MHHAREFRDSTVDWSIPSPCVFFIPPELVTRRRQSSSRLVNWKRRSLHKYGNSRVRESSLFLRAIRHICIDERFHRTLGEDLFVGTFESETQASFGSHTPGDYRIEVASTAQDKYLAKRPGTE
jgi:hypothetical protein